MKSLFIEKTLKEFDDKFSVSHFTGVKGESRIEFTDGEYLEAEKMRKFISQKLEEAMKIKEEEIMKISQEMMEQEIKYTEDHPLAKIEDMRFVSGMATIVGGLYDYSKSLQKEKEEKV